MKSERKKPAKKTSVRAARKQKDKSTAGRKRTRTLSPKATATEEAVLGSAAFRQAASRAEAYANDPQQLSKLLHEATTKSESILRGPLADSWTYLLAMIRLISAYYTGAYRKVSAHAFGLMLLAVIYFVTPLDLVFDWIPTLGLVDDAFVIGFVLKSLRRELDAFIQWEKS